jgi:hypothetical protein
MSPATQVVIYTLVGFVLIAAVVLMAFACKRFGQRHSALRKVSEVTFRIFTHCDRIDLQTPENSARSGLIMNQPMSVPAQPEVFTKRSIVPMNIGRLDIY